MDVGKVLEQQILKTAEVVEGHLDEELRKLELLDEDGLETLREQRLRTLKKQAQQRQHWLAIGRGVGSQIRQRLSSRQALHNSSSAADNKLGPGHGEYSEIPEEKEFFEVIKKSTNVVCHFYKSDSPRCKIVDHHLKIMAKSHVETRFVKLDVERCPFLTGRLRIKIIPTLALVKEGKTKDYIVGFTDLGNCDDFCTDMLEWRIAQADVINYTGNLLEPPDQEKKKTASLLGRDGMKQKIIRGRNSDDSDDDL